MSFGCSPGTRLNQRMWLIADSDGRKGALKPALQRLRDEISAAGGDERLWVTAGYTIENYVERAMLLEAFQRVHPTSTGFKGYRKDRDPLKEVAGKNGALLKNLDKVAIAQAVVEGPANLAVHDLQERVEELAAYLRVP